MRIGIITALDEETIALAGLWNRDGFEVRQGGIGAERSAAAARALLAEGCEALVSAGICGGLARSLPPGSLVLAEAVRHPNGEKTLTDLRWRLALADLLWEDIPLATGVLLGSDRVLRRREHKAEQAALGHVAVDMESHGVARVAAEAGVPLLILRVVSDPADVQIPKSALVGVTPEGHRRPWRVVLGLLRRPRDLTGLIRLALDSKKALDSLSRVATIAGPHGLGLA
ncbi:purine phosphorylase [Magnetospira thiophila]